jgi:hypothetical protein
MSILTDLLEFCKKIRQEMLAYWIHPCTIAEIEIRYEARAACVGEKLKMGSE